MTRYDDPAGRRRPRRPRLATSPLLLVVAGLVVAGPVVAFFTPAVLPGVLNDARSRVPWFPEPGCAVTVIEVVAPPEVVGAVRTAVAGVRGRKLPDGTCAQVRVRDQVPSDTVGGSEVLPPGRAPHVWISDSSLWAGRVRSWRLTGAGSFGSTPVVLVTNPATRAASGWGTAAPSWLAALDGTHPL
ncbi:MAG: Ca-activated chloride channel, partial [Actinomycetota bacterium]|nr:Ca-activated chloride channel [Actinomycetota bacterium]